MPTKKKSKTKKKAKAKPHLIRVAEVHLAEPAPDEATKERVAELCDFGLPTAEACKPCIPTEPGPTKKKSGFWHWFKELWG
jgi:hypothetical protein